MKLFVLSTLPVILAWSLTPSDVSSMASAMSILIAAIFVGLVNIIGARAAARAAVAPISKKIDLIEPIVSKIETHVNSEKTRAEGEIASLRVQLEMQRTTIEELKKATALLAQAKAITDAHGAGAPTPTVAPVPILTSIDKNTEETARNTARTDKTVQDLKEKP